MCSTLINVANTCKNAVCACPESVWSIKVFGSGLGKKTRDVINTVTVAFAYTPQEAGSSVTNDLPQEAALVLPVQQGMVPTSAENSPTVVHDENLRVNIHLFVHNTQQNVIFEHFMTEIAIVLLF